MYVLMYITASEIETLWRYRNVSIVIFIIIFIIIIIYLGWYWLKNFYGLISKKNNFD